MKKLDTRGKITLFLKQIGVIVPQLALVDAIYEIDQRGDLGWGAALWRWWEKHGQKAVPLTPTVCPMCGEPFLSWRGSPQKFCDDRCKRRAENARWYAGHTEVRKAQVVAYRQWSKGLPTEGPPQPLPAPSDAERQTIINAYHKFAWEPDEDDIQNTWKWMLGQGVEAECAVAERAGF